MNGFEVSVIATLVVGLVVDVVSSAIEHQDEWIQIDSIVDDVADSLNETGLTVD